MSSFPGYSKPTAFGIDAGVLTIGGTTVAVTASKDGFTFDPGVTLRHVEFDGKSSDIETLHRPIEYDSHIRGKGLLLSATQLIKYQPGSSSDGSSTNTITPLAARTFMQTGDYLTDVYLIVNRSDGRVVRVYFPKALCVKWQITTKDNNEVEVEFDFKAVIPATATNINAAPYVIQDAA